MSNSVLQDCQKMGIKILQDCKTAKRAQPDAKKIPEKAAPPSEPLDIHQAAVKKFIKEKPHRKHLLEFFERVIETEEKKL
jgi:hypothetical protein